MVVGGSGGSVRARQAELQGEEQVLRGHPPGPQLPLSLDLLLRSICVECSKRQWSPLTMFPSRLGESSAPAPVHPKQAPPPPPPPSSPAGVAVLKGCSVQSSADPPRSLELCSAVAAAAVAELLLSLPPEQPLRFARLTVDLLVSIPRPQLRRSDAELPVQLTPAHLQCSARLQ